MNNKEIIQAHNMDLQRIKETIAALPAAKSWGGGAPIIEPSAEDVIIPAFTGVDLTVKGVDVSKFGFAEGTVTIAAAGTIEIAHNIGSIPSVAMIYIIDGERNGRAVMFAQSPASVIAPYVGLTYSGDEYVSHYSGHVINVTSNSMKCTMLDNGVTYRWILIK